MKFWHERQLSFAHIATVQVSRKVLFSIPLPEMGSRLKVELIWGIKADAVTVGYKIPPRPRYINTVYPLVN